MTDISIIFTAILLAVIIDNIGDGIRDEVSRLADEVRKLREKL